MITHSDAAKIRRQRENGFVLLSSIGRYLFSKFSILSLSIFFFDRRVVLHNTIIVLDDTSMPL